MTQQVAVETGATKRRPLILWFGGFLAWLIAVAVAPGIACLLSLGAAIACVVYMVKKLRRFSFKLTGLVAVCLVSSFIALAVKATRSKGEEVAAEADVRFDKVLTDANALMSQRNYAGALAKYREAKSISASTRPRDSLDSMILDSAVLGGDEKTVAAFVQEAMASLSKEELSAIVKDGKLPASFGQRRQEVAAALIPKAQAAARGALQKLGKQEANEKKECFESCTSEMYTKSMNESFCNSNLGDICTRCRHTFCQVKCGWCDPNPATSRWCDGKEGLAKCKKEYGHINWGQF